MKRLSFVAACLAIISLGGCSHTITMQAASVTQLADGSEWVMTGTIEADFERNSLTRLSGDGLTCELPMVMRVDRSGAGTMTCRDQNGEVIYEEEQVIPAGVYGTSLRGTFVDTVNTPLGRGRLAFGWGSFADPDHLRTLLP